jgi:hypothetical protein
MVTDGCLPQLPPGRAYQLGVSGGVLLDDSRSLEANGVTAQATLRVTLNAPGAVSALTREPKESEI